jgi:NCAIR mutase (PurE)-related protein
MHEDQLRELLEQVREGAVDVDAALGRMRHLPFEDLGFAKVTIALRHGMPEVAARQDAGADAAIAERLLERAPNVLITRADRRRPASF